jgi:hypothetical protein
LARRSRAKATQRVGPAAAGRLCRLISASSTFAKATADKSANDLHIFGEADLTTRVTSRAAEIFQNFLYFPREHMRKTKLSSIFSPANR